MSVDIVDISKPWAPVMVAEYNLNERFPQIEDPTLGSAESFLHDMIVKEVEPGVFHMLLSYWDGGYVVMDVTDPRNATYVADSDFTDPDPEAAESGFIVRPEGNAHQAEFTRDDKFIVAADEDFGPYKVVPKIPEESKEFDATQGTDVPQIDQDDPLSGEVVLFGRACNGDPNPGNGDAISTPSGQQIALVERGLCTFSEKLANVEAAGGYEGAIVFNRQGSDGCSDLLTMAVQGGIPALFVGRDTGFDLMEVSGYDDPACRANAQPFPYSTVPIGTVGDFVDISAIFDGWGYVHLYANEAGKLVELDTYAVPEAHDPAYAQGFGDLSVHEVAVSQAQDDLLYFSYYAAGFRVARIEGNEIVEKGFFIGEGGNNFGGYRSSSTAVRSWSPRRTGTSVCTSSGTTPGPDAKPAGGRVSLRPPAQLGGERGGPRALRAVCLRTHVRIDQQRRARSPSSRR